MYGTIGVFNNAIREDCFLTDKGAGMRMLLPLMWFREPGGGRGGSGVGR
jgi:hypothetical protein